MNALDSRITYSWHTPTIDALGVGNAAGALPTIVSSAEPIGTIVEGALRGATLTGCIGDQQAAMMGQRCFAVGEAKITFGTGAFLLMNAGTAPVPSKAGLLSTVLYRLGASGETQYALEGAVACCAVGINWFKDSLGMIAKPAEISDLAGAVPGGTDGLYFVSVRSSHSPRATALSLRPCTPPAPHYHARVRQPLASHQMPPARAPLLFLLAHRRLAACSPRIGAMTLARPSSASLLHTTSGTWRAPC